MRINLTDKIFCEQCPCSPWNWDLYQVQPGVRKGELIDVEKPLGIYGLSLQKVIEYIPDIHLQLGGEGKDVLSLEGYIEEFKKIQNEAIQNIKESINKFNESIKNDSI